MKKIINKESKKKAFIQTQYNEADTKEEALEAENESEKILEHEKGVN